MKNKLFLGIVVVLLSVFLVATGQKTESRVESHPNESGASTATVSGTIRHNGNPVSGVEVNLVWFNGQKSSSTGSGGTYSVGSIPLGTWLQIFVRPPITEGLEYRNWGTESLTGNLVNDFDLAEGHRLEGRFYKPNGSALTKGFWLKVNFLEDAPPAGEWTGDRVDDSGRFNLMVADGIYNLKPNQDQLVPYFMPHRNLVIKGNKTGLKITLLDEIEPPFPTTPPVLSKIQVGSPDKEGVAHVTGLADSVAPLSAVAVINLSAKNFATTISNNDGSFKTSLFAPPGSSLLIKYDRQGERVSKLKNHSGISDPAGDFSYMNPLPGATFQVGLSRSESGRSKAFDSAGSIINDIGWAGWWITGTLSGPAGTSDLQVSRGDQMSMAGTLYITSAAFDCQSRSGADPKFGTELEYLFDAAGRSEPWGIWFSSHLFTPTGLPIEKEASGATKGVGDGVTENISCSDDSDDHTLQATISHVFTITADIPDGIYRPRIFIEPGAITYDTNEDVTAVWYHPESQRSFLPPVTVGEVAPPRIPWTLFGDYPINGHRGVQAYEDVGYYSMPTRVVIPPRFTIVPMIDERSGRSIEYRLEPGSHWLSATDRRSPPPPHIPLAYPDGQLQVEIHKPDGTVETIKSTQLLQSSVRTPTVPGGSMIAEGTGHIGDLYHLSTMDDRFSYAFDQYGFHTVVLEGKVVDVYGNEYDVSGTYEFLVARVLDLDPAQLPTTPYEQGDYFAPGLHVYPPVPADVEIKVTHMSNSDPNNKVEKVFSGKANRFGYFQPPKGNKFQFQSPGEFRVDVFAQYWAPDGTIWAGTMTWGNVVEGLNAKIEAHGKRGMDYKLPAFDSRHLPWFTVHDLDQDMTGIEVYYPYFSGDIYWGNEDTAPGDSVHTIITIKDKAAAGTIGPIYDEIKQNYAKARNPFRWPPTDAGMTGLEERLRVHEAPLFITTHSGIDAAVDSEYVDQWGYYYGSSERPDVRVREIISEDNMGTAYWRYNDTYGYQIGEGAAGDLPGDLKWHFGGAVFRIPDKGINEYAIYGSLWVLLPLRCDQQAGECARVTAPFRDPAGVSIDGGPIMTLLGEDINVLFLPKGIRPGDILEISDTVSFSGHVGPPLNSRVDVKFTSPSGKTYSKSLEANKIGWVYYPSFDLIANEVGRWTVDIQVVHDKDHIPTGATKEIIEEKGNNKGTVLGTQGSYSFYVVEPETRRLFITSPPPGFLTWPEGKVVPVTIRGLAPKGTSSVHYTIFDKGTVMGQGTLSPKANGSFELIYDPVKLNQSFPFLSLTAHEGLWEGLADEVTISLLATGGQEITANTVTLIGEQVFLGNELNSVLLPALARK